MDMKKKIGILLFLFNALYMIGIGWGFGWWSASTYRNLSLAEISHTVWTMGHPLFWFWALSIPCGAILVSIGILLLVNAKGNRILFIGPGLLLTNVFIQLIPEKPHMPPMFGVFGGIILILFLLTVWMWKKKRVALEKDLRVAADLQLIGYVFLIIAMWFLCGSLGRLFFPSLSTIKPDSPIHIIIYLTLGWLFMFLSHYKEAKILQK